MSVGPALPTEADIADRCGGNPLVAMILLLDADPQLRRRFRAETAEVLDEFGLGCPADFIGVRGRACPAMPEMPGGGADVDIADPYWASWLHGGVRQVDPYRSALGDDVRLPERDALSSFEWKILVERVRTVIRRAVASIDGESSDVSGSAQPGREGPSGVPDLRR